MDSLLSTYASSDEENDDQPRPQAPPSQRPSNPLTSSSTSLFSLPPPKSTPLFSLPLPKSLNPLQNPKSDPASRSLFNSIPPPRSQAVKIQENRQGKKKQVVQFTPPVMNLAGGDEDSDDEDEGERERKRRRDAQNSSGEAASVKSFLSSVLPAPKHSRAVLGAAAGQAGGAGRRSVIDPEVPSLKQQQVQIQMQQQRQEASVYVDSNAAATNEAVYDGYGCDLETVGSCGVGGGVDGGDSSWHQGGGGEAYGDYSGGGGEYESYGGAYPQYESNWIDRSGGGSVSYSSIPEAPDVDVTMARVMGKRGRNVIPAENIIEVRQDELMKNRPREDQVKATGIAFGPAYQPASSAKGKPSKLHKRKHQIGALYFDMKQKETELADRRARGFLTKAETHAKYGW